MKKTLMKWALLLVCMAVGMPAMAQFNVKDGVCERIHRLDGYSQSGMRGRQ